jgi:NodT family efflux transporter outer membrane factor (OMF) lipoprotein
LKQADPERLLPERLQETPQRLRPLRWACASAAVSCALIGLAACVGPNFRRPAPPAVDRYTAEALPPETTSAQGSGGAAQKFLMENDVPRDWWTRFRSDELNALVIEALRANPSVQAATAALRQANENTAAQRGFYYPTVQAGFDATRQRDAVGVLAPNLASGTALYNLFTPQVTVSYVPDVFGLNRRQVETLAAAAESAQFQLEATYLTLTANVVTAAIQEAGLRAQIAATERVIALEQVSLAVMRRELELGAIPEGDIFAQDAALAQLEAQLPPLHRQLQTTRDLLAALTGHLPANYTPARFELSDLTLPTDLPLGIPSQLVERRPDVRAAEAELHAATAQVGVAIASLLPQVTLTGDFGSSATAVSDLFKAGTGFWSVGAGLTQTLFEGGTLIHRKRAANAALDQAAALYRSAVLTAFQNVADALHALDTDAAALSAAARAESAAQKSLEVVQHQLELGSVSYLALVNAEQTYQQALILTVQARANRYADTAALFQALGGSIAPERASSKPATH